LELQSPESPHKSAEVVLLPLRARLATPKIGDFDVSEIFRDVSRIFSVSESAEISSEGDRSEPEETFSQFELEANPLSDDEL
jgi:hypothetical protein